ncbi:hypothetical protein BDZ89DRAFT_1143079 [Hymenopellis radicata]|nr:hypothetical protein BDZ89DRAFT_1143079 [Hymenopellis radicata]
MFPRLPPPANPGKAIGFSVKKPRVPPTKMLKTVHWSDDVEKTVHWSDEDQLQLERATSASLREEIERLKTEHISEIEFLQVQIAMREDVEHSSERDDDLRRKHETICMVAVNKRENEIVGLSELVKSQTRQLNLMQKKLTALSQAFRVEKRKRAVEEEDDDDLVVEGV